MFATKKTARSEGIKKNHFVHSKSQEKKWSKYFRNFQRINKKFLLFNRDESELRTTLDTTNNKHCKQTEHFTILSFSIKVPENKKSEIMQRRRHNIGRQ